MRLALDAEPDLARSGGGAGRAPTARPAHAAGSPENTTAYKTKLYEFVCQATGGPCTYTGRSMEESHSGLNLIDKDFDAFVGDLAGALNEAKVDKSSQKKLLAILGPMRPQVVGQ